MKKLILFTIMLMTSISSYAVDNTYFFEKFNRGMVTNFQEKLYIQTDRDSYTTGETIWFRVHRVDATYHNPTLYSGLVYVDVYDFSDKLIKRMMISPRDSVFQGTYRIPSNMAHGSCYMVAYTNWSQNFSSDLYYRRKIFINNPQNKKTRVTHTVTKESRDRLRYNFEITTVAEYAWLDEGYLLDVTLVTRDTVKPHKVVTRSIDPDGKSNVTFPISDSILYLSLEFNGGQPESFTQRFIVPYTEDKIDLQFMPEGGHLIAGMNQRVAFKAVSIDGMGAQISGSVFKKDGSMVAFFGAAHAGMGDFMLTVEEGESYYAEFAMPDGTVKRVDLPAVESAGVMLSCTAAADLMKIAVLATPTISWEGKFLLVQCRGKLLQAIPLTKNSLFNLPTKDLPNGIIHCSVVDADGVIYSQRLLFNNHDNASTVQVDNLKSLYAKRNMVDLDLTFVNAAGSPVAGSFTASVVDDKRAVVDTVEANIRGYLLLSSDLNGYVENPNYYFDTDEPASRRIRGADLLMLTQGWRRFDLTDLIKETKREYEYSLQLGQVITGRLKNLWKDEGRGGSLAVFSTAARIFKIFTADEETGYFEVSGVSFPQGTKLTLKAVNEKGKNSIEIELEEEGFRTIMNPPIDSRYLLRESAELATSSTNKFDEFYRDLSVDFYYENGVKVYIMDEISVSAEADDDDYIAQMYKDLSEKYITGDELTSEGYVTVWDWLAELPGVEVDEDEYTVTARGGSDVSLIIDDITYEMSELSLVVMEDIESIGFSTDIATLSMVDGGSDGAIMIQLKDAASMGSSQAKETASFFTITPMGYSQADTFYVARFDTPELLNNTDFDGRVTVHWEPSIIVDETGKAKLQFYTADFPANYILRIEGVTAAGDPLFYSTRIRNNN